MAESDDNTPGQHASAVWFRAALDRIEADLLAVVQEHSPAIGRMATCHALIELTGSVCAAVAEADPMARADIDSKLGALQLYVASTRQTPQ